MPRTMAARTTILGTGVDIAEVARIRELIAKSGERFLARVFTDGERAYCEARGRPEESYAARFAAKEAVMKALGTGWSGGVTFQDTDVVRGASGPPEVVLSGKLRERADELGVRRVHLSLSHTDTQAIAFVIAEG